MQDRYYDLVSERVRRNMERQSPSWGGAARPDAVPLNYGFPYPESYPLEDLIEACATALREDGSEALRYGGGPLAGEFDAMVADRCNERGLQVDDENIIVTNGSAQAITVVCDLLIDPDDVVLVEAPTYMGALREFENFCADVRGVDMDDDGILTEELERILADGVRPKFLYTMPNFHNPAGCTMSMQRRRRLLELAEEYNFLLVEDDAYGELRYEGEDLPALRALDETDRVFHLGSMSKILAPGFRLGWIIGPPSLMEQGDRLKVDGGTGPFVRAMIGAYLREIDLDERIIRIREGYRRRRDAALRALREYMPEGCSWSEPEGGYFLWLTLPESVDVTVLMEDIAEAGANPLAGNIFFPDDRGRNNLRLSFSYPDEAELERGIRAIARVTAGQME